MMSDNKEVGFSYCQATIALRDKIEESFLQLGQRLMTIRDEELFQGQWTSFPEFLQELKISESVASRLISVYKNLVVEYGLSQEKVLSVGWSDAYHILKASNSKEEAEALLDKGQVLSSSDLRKELTEKKTGILMANCEHTNTYVIKVCRVCGYKESILDDNDER